jgi:hypothetical protein
MVVEDEVRHDALGELRVAGPGLAVDEREVVVMPSLRCLQVGEVSFSTRTISRFSARPIMPP